MTTRFTPAQLRALRLLATPGAEAIVPDRSIRWRVLVAGVEIGTIHAESLLPLRLAGLVQLLGGRHTFDWRQRLTEAGRAYLAATMADQTPSGAPRGQKSTTDTTHDRERAP